MERNYSIDVARVISCFLVIMTHVSAYWSYKFQSEWEVVNFYNSLSRCAVPVFVMISGALLIKKEIDIVSFYKSKLPKSILYLFSWSLLYYILFKDGQKDPFDFIRTLLTKQTMYHLWYLYFLVGMYIFTPFISLIYYSVKPEKVLLLITVVIAVYQLNLLHSLTGLNLAGKFNLSTLMSLSWYMIIGKYIQDINLSEKFRPAIILSFIIAILLTALFNSLHSHSVGKPVSTFLDNYAINTAIAAAALFTLCKAYNNNYINKASSKISNYTFAIYCIHPAILIPLRPYVWEYRWGGNMAVYLPLICILMFILSFLAAYILKNTPLIKRIC